MLIELDKHQDKVARDMFSKSFGELSKRILTGAKDASIPPCILLELHGRIVKWNQVLNRYLKQKKANPKSKNKA